MNGSSINPAPCALDIKKSPEDESPESHAHTDPTDVASAHEPVDAEADQNCGGRVVHGVVRKFNVGERGDRDDDGNGRDVAERERNDRAQDGARALLLKAQRDREEPAHRGVEAVVTAEQKEREPDVAIAHAAAL